MTLIVLLVLLFVLALFFVRLLEVKLQKPEEILKKRRRRWAKELCRAETLWKKHQAYRAALEEVSASEIECDAHFYYVLLARFGEAGLNAEQLHQANEWAKDE